MKDVSEKGEKVIMPIPKESPEIYLASSNTNIWNFLRGRQCTHVNALKNATTIEQFKLELSKLIILQNAETREKFVYCYNIMPCKEPPKPVEGKNEDTNEYLTGYSKFKAEKGIKEESKVFSITGEFPDVRDWHIKNGWIENKDPESIYFDFKWGLRGKDINREMLQKYQVINHFQKNNEITTKVGICHNLKSLIWKEKVDVDTFYPLCYEMIQTQIGDFTDEFEFNRALSILKNIIIDKRTIDEVGKWKTLTALKICEGRAINDLLSKRQIISEEEWDLLSCYKNKESILLSAKCLNVQKGLELQYPEWSKLSTIEMDKTPELIKRIVYTLEKLKSTYPQYYLNSGKNVWILKPAGLSRGRGIYLFNNLKRIFDYMKGRHFVIQKYIENPLIIENRKFDMRQWVLVTSMNPLAVWIYDEMYARFSSEDYDPNAIYNVYMHLTNNSINKHNPHEEKIKGNMWDDATFSKYLDSKFGDGSYKKKVRSRIEDIVVWTLKSANDKIRHRDHSFEIYGFDFMIDELMNVWLIEVNSSPAMDYSTDITKRYIQNALADAMKIVHVYETAPADVKAKMDTGHFKLLVDERIK
jgi:tubulin monoglycylase TTLL3/8